MPAKDSHPEQLGQVHNTDQQAGRATRDWDVGRAAVTVEERAGGRFLHQYGTVGQTEVAQVVSYLRSNGATIPDKAGDRTIAYLKFMADTVDDGILTGDPDSVRRQIDAHVIKADNVPESYFALQRRIAREQGHGNIDIDEGMKQQLVEAAQADQRASLEKWVEYLGGDDGSYPDWFKRYTWDSVLKIGAYDKERAKFDRRDASTVAPYPELNREALAYTYDTVKKFHVLGESIDDAKLKQILKEGSFGRLYAYAITELTPDNLELRNNIEGSWTKFHQTTDPRTARRLSGSLQGHGTGWCTAGESTAEAQLNTGDFYVYYTRDEDGKDTIPRVAIRMQNGEVAEVRGVQPSQELEPVMTDITSAQLQHLPGGEKYIKRASDMKRLTALDHLLSENPEVELSISDAAFLYELDHTIEGFGYDDDPRVRALQLQAANAHTATLLEQIDSEAIITKRVRNHTRVHELLDRARQDEETELSNSDLSFIYGLDGPIQTLDPDDVQIAKSMDYYRDGQDRERLIELMPGAIERQYPASLEGYKATIRSLGIETIDIGQLEHELSLKLAVWKRQGVYQYMMERLIEQDTQFNLVMTPNIIASPDQIMTSAQQFGDRQPYETYIYSELYKQYSGEELSGAVEEGVTARFGLMPGKDTQEIGFAPAAEQLTKLEQLRSHLPQLTLRAPSVLDALSYWQSLRARGDALADDDAYFRTCMRHFDLPHKRRGSFLRVPFSCVRNAGGPRLYDSLAENDGNARVLVG